MFLFLLARNCLKRSKSFKPLETCQTGCWSCQTTTSGKARPKLPVLPANALNAPNGCQTKGWGKASVSFSPGPKLPDAPFKRLKRSKGFKLFETCQTGSWSCRTRGLKRLPGAPAVSGVLCQSPYSLAAPRPGLARFVGFEKLLERLRRLKGASVYFGPGEKETLPLPQPLVWQPLKRLKRLKGAPAVSGVPCQRL